MTKADRTRHAPEFVSIAVAADTVGVSTRTIRRYVAAGHIAAWRLGPRLLRIDLNELREFMKPIPTGVEL